MYRMLAKGLGFPVRSISLVRSRLCSTSEDTFGDIAPDLISSHEQNRDVKEHLDDQDGEEEYRAKISDIYRPKPVDYLRKMNDLVRKNQVQAALSLLDDDMKRECVRPGEKHYRILIHACGKVGHARKAFALFRDYNMRMYRFNYGIYGDLFNACANCPDKDYALGKALQFREKLNLYGRGNHPQILYHIMIKAFGRCGDLQSAFALFDEMNTKRVPITEDTYKHLISGCISDSKSGFRHAVFVWRKLLKSKRVKPNLVLLHLMLRCTLECKAGDTDFTHDLMLECMTVEEARTHHIKLLEAPKKSGKDTIEGQHLESGLILVENTSEITPKSMDILNVPNLLERTPKFENVITLGALDKPQDRFMLLGGVQGFLDWMKSVNIKPDIKVISYMLDLIENNKIEEQRLLDIAMNMNVSLDNIFLNKLIKLRTLRKDNKGGFDVLELFNKYGVEVDIITYENLAFACQNHKFTMDFVNSMKKSNYSLNLQIIKTLLKNACKRRSIGSILYLLNVLEKEDLKPDPVFLKTLETFRRSFREEILKLERGQTPNQNYNNKYDLVQKEMDCGFKLLKVFDETYETFLRTRDVDLPPDNFLEQFYTQKDRKKK